MGISKAGVRPRWFSPRGYKVEKVQIGLKRNGQPRYASKWVPDEAYWDRAKQAFEMWADGRSLLEIDNSTRLFKSRQAYSVMFRNRTYWGVGKCGDLQVEGAHPAIADADTLRKVVERNERETRKAHPGQPWPKGREHPRRKASSFLLSGLLECGYCGSAMIGSTTHRSSKRGRPWRHYVCSLKRRKGAKSCRGSRIAAHTVDTKIAEAVLDRVLTPDYISCFIQEINAELAKDLEGRARRIRQKERELASLQRGIESLLDLAETAGSQAARARLIERENEKTKLIGELSALREQKEHSRIEVSPEVLRAALVQMRETLSRKDTEAKRMILKQFIEKIVIEGR